MPQRDAFKILLCGAEHLFQQISYHLDWFGWRILLWKCLQLNLCFRLCLFSILAHIFLFLFFFFMFLKLCSNKYLFQNGKRLYLPSSYHTFNCSFIFRPHFTIHIECSSLNMCPCTCSPTERRGIFSCVFITDHIAYITSKTHIHEYTSHAHSKLRNFPAEFAELVSEGRTSIYIFFPLPHHRPFSVYLVHLLYVGMKHNVRGIWKKDEQKNGKLLAFGQSFIFGCHNDHRGTIYLSVHSHHFYHFCMLLSQLFSILMVVLEFQWQSTAYWSIVNAHWIVNVPKLKHDLINKIRNRNEKKYFVINIHNNGHSDWLFLQLRSIYYIYCI